MVDKPTIKVLWDGTFRRSESLFRDTEADGFDVGANINVGDKDRIRLLLKTWSDDEEVERSIVEIEWLDKDELGVDSWRKLDRYASSANNCVCYEQYINSDDAEDDGQVLEPKFRVIEPVNGEWVMCLIYALLQTTS